MNMLTDWARLHVDAPVRDTSVDHPMLMQAFRLHLRMIDWHSYQETMADAMDFSGSVAHHKNRGADHTRALKALDEVFPIASSAALVRWWDEALHIWDYVT